MKKVLKTALAWAALAWLAAGCAGILEFRVAEEYRSKKLIEEARPTE